MKAKAVVLVLLSAPFIILGFFFNLFSSSVEGAEKDYASISVFEKASADVGGSSEGFVGEGCCEGSEGGGSCGL